MSSDLSTEATPMDRCGNRLLAALPVEVLARMRPGLERVSLPLGKVLCEPGEAMKWVYFPCDCILSMVYVTEDGHSAEICVIGNDGVLGISVALGGNSMPEYAVVRSEGDAFRMRAEAFRNEFDRPGGELHELLLRYIQTTILQMAQTAVCNRHHDLAQQFARWILVALDRLPCNRLTMTQELIANMLGVRRESVTGAARELQRLGIIDCGRGIIRVLDRVRLEQEACECYRVVRREAERLLPALKVGLPSAEDTLRNDVDVQRAHRADTDPDS